MRTQRGCSSGPSAFATAEEPERPFGGDHASLEDAFGEFRPSPGPCETAPERRLPLGEYLELTMENVVYGIAVILSVVMFGFVMYMFIWAARKDGQEDRAVQKKLGIHRKTRLGL